MRGTRIVTAMGISLLMTAASAPAQHDHSMGAEASAQTDATQSAAGDYRARVASDLQRAAGAVGVRIDEGKLMVATRDDAFVAVAPAYEKENVFLFMQTSFADASCAAVLPAGYYSVRIVPVKKGTPTKAQFINSEGKVAVTGDLTSQTRKATEAEKDKLQIGVQLRHTGGAQARTIVGVCRCQWIPWFRWRRLHVVVT